MPHIAKNFFKGKMSIWNGVNVFFDVVVEPPPPPPPIELPLLVKQQRYRVKLKTVINMENISLEFTNGDIVNCSVYNGAWAVETHEQRLRTVIGSDLIAYFHGIVSEKKLLVTLYDVDGFRIPITEPGPDAPESIDPLCPARILRSSISGYVSNYGENYIYLQPADFDDEIDKLKENLREYYNEVYNDPAEIKVGNPVVYRSVTRECYRGVIRSIQDKDVTVYFVDFGVTNVVHRLHLREMALDFVDLCEYCIKINVGKHAPNFNNRFVKGTLRYGRNEWEGTFEIDEPYRQDHLKNFQHSGFNAGGSQDPVERYEGAGATSADTVTISEVAMAEDLNTKGNVHLPEKPAEQKSEEG